LERLQYLAICESRLLHLQNSLLTRKFYFSQRWISGGITDYRGERRQRRPGHTDSGFDIVTNGRSVSSHP
ncbi:hypothetical protein, partial [Burkholderia sp. BCC0801]|uniref:hypothetical protein n=1 Tax=Burkholderia sp. BCC0801 TaxID=2676291 RepID=UPI001ABABEB3